MESVTTMTANISYYTNSFGFYKRRICFKGTCSGDQYLWSRW